MPEYCGALTILLIPVMVLARVRLLKIGGVRAMKFGALDKTDFLIPPFVLLYFYLIFAGAFRLPSPVQTELFHSQPLKWIGVFVCVAALVLVVLSLASFRTSFRVGIDAEQPGALVTSGIFGHTRNPMYVAFGLLLLGEFLIQPNWVFLLYFLAALALFHRQVLREEAYLRGHYGDAYRAYSERVRRYF